MKHLLSAILLLISFTLQAQVVPRNTNRNLSPDGTLGLSERNYTPVDSMTVDSVKRRLIGVGTAGVTSYTALNDRPASLSSFTNDLNFRNQSQVQATTSQTWADSANSNKIYFGSGFSGLGTQANPLTVSGSSGTSITTDANVQAGSTNPVQSGGVKTYVDAATATLQSGVNATTAKVAANTSDINSLSATLGTKQNASALGTGIAAYLTGLPGYGPGKVLSSDLTWIQPAATTAVQTQLSAPTLTVGTTTTSTVPLVIGSAANATVYTVQYDLSSTFTSSTSFTAASGSYTVTDLSANTTYYFRVKATANGFTDSPYSATYTAITAPALVSNVQLASSTLSATTSTSASIALSWTATPNATSYNVQQDVSSAFAAPTTIYSGAATSFTAQGLTAGTTYYYRVQATAGTGFTASAYSNTANATTTNAPAVSMQLAAPTLSATTSTSASIALSWTVPANATGYVLQQDVSSAFSTPTDLYTGEATSFTAQGLTAGTTYYYRVQATAGTGFTASAYSNTANATTTNAPAVSVQLTAPTLSATTSTSASIALSWTASPNATGYSVQQDVSSTFSAPTTVYSGAATSFTAQGLTAGTTYYYRVQATAGTGFSASAFSNTANATTANAPTVIVQLAAPTLSAATSTSASIALSWTVPANATGYVLQQDVSSTFSAPTTAYSGAATSFTAQGLTAGTAYYYRVQATAGMGFTASAYSNTANATTTTSSPVSAPLTLAPVTSWNLTGNASNNAVVTNTNSVSQVAATGVSYVVANQKTTGLSIAIVSMDVSTTVASGIIGLDQGTGWVSNNGFDISIQYTDSHKVIVQSNSSYLAQPVINGVTNLRIRTDGTNAYGEYSTNSGNTWTPVPSGKVTQLPNQYLKGIVQAKGVSLINVQSAGLN